MPFGSVLGGGFADKYVPKEIRDLLVAESASNDGLAYPFLSISIYLTTEASRATAFGKWAVISCLCAQKIHPVFLMSRSLMALTVDQVILGTAFGAIIGMRPVRLRMF